ncbi:MAG TPA: hypothetical protein VFM18_23130 [Methanosarcina sp.]|nr:hypothetical protein [Methanosarcina sp.]
MNPHIHVDYELPFAKDVIRPGDIIRIKADRGRFRFIRVATNMEKNVTWVDCFDVASGDYRSFYVEKIKLVERPKKSRRKKQGVPRHSTSA